VSDAVDFLLVSFIRYCIDIVSLEQSHCVSCELCFQIYMLAEYGHFQLGL
jgi:hypothetical protein